MKDVNGPTLDDFIEEGKAMESAVRNVGHIYIEKESPCNGVSECRELAIGIIAIAHSAAQDFTEHIPFNQDLAYCLACTAAFAQGATTTSSLIAQGQYMKAAAAMKQDVELLARFHEIVEGRAIEGKTPQMSCVSEWGRRHYGELNKIAHPSNFEEMHSVLSFPNGHISILPVRQPETELALQKGHVWSCAEMAAASIELLASFMDVAHEPVPEMRLEPLMVALERLFDKVLSLLS